MLGNSMLCKPKMEVLGTILSGQVSRFRAILAAKESDYSESSSAVLRTT